MKITPGLFWISLLFCIATTTMAESPACGEDLNSLTVAIESRVPQIMEEHHVPGLSMVLIRDNRIVWTKCFGVRVAGKPEPVDAETIFEAASMSKPLFCYAVLKLVDQGAFDLDRPLDAYLDAPYLPDEALANKITGRMAMLHRTGLPNWRPGGWKSGNPLVVEYEPDSRFTYSGEGILYLQKAVERVTGQPLEAWMQSRLLVPLGMNRSSYEWQDRFEADFAGGHDKDGNVNEKRRFYKEGNAAFSLYTTPTDYARLLIEMMNRDRSAPHSISPAMIEKMTTLQVEPEKDGPRSRRALGWVVEAPEEGGHVWHTGTNGAGFHCVSRFDMARRSGCVIMTNNVGAREACEAILDIIDKATDKMEDKTTDETALGADDDDKISTDRFTTWSPRRRTIRYEYRIVNPTEKPATELEVFVPLPVDTPRQEIHYLRFPAREPDRIFTDGHGQRLTQYSIERLEPGEWIDLGYVVGITLRNMRWNEPGSGPEGAIELTPEQRELYLRPETYYSMDSPLMRETAVSLVEGAETDFEKLTRIHDHVIESIRYVLDDQWDPAETVLARGSGSCSEYNYVFSGLCRLAGLPTRCVGGTINSFREMPTTDVVFHRWTEVFLPGYGWFPVDCSRDANPIRGPRSHFGRVYSDAMIWSHQAAGEEAPLGWDYRAHAHVKGEDPGIHHNHRVRWFEFHPEKDLDAACAWLLEGGQEVPEPDLLECALLDWDQADADARLRIIDALTRAGRVEAIRRAVLLPLEGDVRRDCLGRLCASPELADEFLANSQDPWEFRNWFKKRESRLNANEEHRFELSEKNGNDEPAETAATSSEIWNDLAREAADRFVEKQAESHRAAIVIMPLVDQSSAGLGPQRDAIFAAIRAQISESDKFQLLDDAGFDRWMREHGPGGGEYWILANGRYTMPQDLAPELIVVPVAIVAREEKGVLYQLSLRVLQLSDKKSTTISAQKRRVRQAEPSERGVLVAGGDTVLARWEHDLVGRHDYRWPLAGVAETLSAADAALCNLECCVSLRGEPAEKGERCPFYYRARPEMLRCLTLSGIDIVTTANNHGGDYGPIAVEDTSHWCETAGIACVGSGRNAADAETARLVQVGPVRVGVGAIDTTMPRSAAGEDRAGMNFAAEDEGLELFTEKVKRLGQWADGRCDLLVLTIHWGPNWDAAPTETRRRMARIALENGVDLILGHSAHRLQGIEVIDGKPVVYDMGNLLFDCELSPEGRRTALFRLHVSKGGVHRIEIIPAEALNGYTVLADSAGGRKILAEMDQLCSNLGTKITLDENLEGRPIGVVAIDRPSVTPRQHPPSDESLSIVSAKEADLPTSADKELLQSDVPEDAQRPDSPVVPIPGVELLGWRLPGTADEGGMLRIQTWWRVTGPVNRHVLLAFHVRPEGETPRRGTPWYTRHDAADWSAPLHLIEPGTSFEDDYPCRLAGLPPGPYKVYAMLLDTNRPEAEQILGRPRLLGEIEIKPSGDE